jgi:hypothetical protein
MYLGYISMNNNRMAIIYPDKFKTKF